MSYLSRRQFWFKVKKPLKGLLIVTCIIVGMGMWFTEPVWQNVPAYWSVCVLLGVVVAKVDELK